MQVRQILAIKGKALYTITPDKTVTEAIAIMVENDVGSLVCFDNKRMVGMLTFRELLKAVYQFGAKAGDAAIASIMVRNPQSVPPDAEINELRLIMLRSRARYLPVMDGEIFLGVVSFHDVARAVLDEQGFEIRQLKDYILGHPSVELAT
ncbi:MAG: CBS domain-containing protein [Betaproteobacteria bacterium]|nr:CBS domain-containing protein [Betaproteobacteria bacterium]